MTLTAGQIEIPLRKAISGLEVTVTFTGLRRAAFRFWLAAQVVRLAAWIAGCDAAVEVETKTAGTTMVSHQPLSGPMRTDTIPIVEEGSRTPLAPPPRPAGAPPPTRPSR